ALRGLATLLMRRGDPARAVKALERAIAIDPGDATLPVTLEEARAQARAPRPPRDAPKAEASSPNEDAIAQAKAAESIASAARLAEREALLARVDGAKRAGAPVAPP